MNIFRLLARWTVCLCFLMQMVTQPILAAQDMAGPSQGRQPSAPDHPLNMQFADGVPVMEQDLLTGFIAYVRDLAWIHPQFRRHQIELSLLIEQEKALLPEAEEAFVETPQPLAQLRTALDKLVDEGIPLENRLEGWASKYESQFNDKIELLSASSVVPDGFLQLTRQLEQTYQLSETLYRTKAGLLTDYIVSLKQLQSQAATNQDYGLADRIASHLVELGALAANLEPLEGEIATAKTAYQAVLAAYVAAADTALQEERQRTASLAAALEGGAAILAAHNDDNSGRHAQLLKLAEQSLKNRLILIEQEHATTAKANPHGNPLYLPQDLPISGELGNLTTAYSDISHQLIQSTLDREEDLAKLQQLVGQIREGLPEQKLALSAMTWQMEVENGTSELVVSMQDAIDSMSQQLDRQTTSLANIVNDYAAISGSSAADLAADAGLSWQIIGLNQQVEALLDSLQDLQVYQQQVNLLGAALIADGGLYETTSAQLLINSTESLTELVRQGLDQVSLLTGSFTGDQQLFSQLETLGGEVLATANSLYSRVYDEVAALATDEDSFRNQSLQGSLEVLSQRKQETALFLHAMEARQERIAQGQSCPNCDRGLTSWSQTTAIGDGVTDVLVQLASAEQLQELFTTEEDGLFADAKRLFALGQALRVSSQFALHDSSIDVSFTFGTRTLFLQGIGNTDTLLLANTTLPAFSRIPYIGDLGLIDAWNSLGNRVETTISDAKASAGKTFDSVIDGAKAVGGAISTSVSRAKSRVVDTWHTIADTGKAVGSYLADTGDNLFLKDSNQGWSVANFSLWKTAALALKGAACAAGTGASSGLATAAACAPLAADFATAMAKAGIDRTDMSEEAKASSKFAWDIFNFAVGGVSSLSQAALAGTLNGMSNAQKLLTFLGFDPSSGLTGIKNILTNLINGKWNGLRNLINSSDFMEVLNLIANIGGKQENLDLGNGPLGLWGAFKALIDAYTNNPQPSATADSPTTNGGNQPTSSDQQNNSLSSNSMNNNGPINSSQLNNSGQVNSSQQSSSTLQASPVLNQVTLRSVTRQAAPALNPAFMAPLPALNSVALQSINQQASPTLQSMDRKDAPALQGITGTPIGAVQSVDLQPAPTLRSMPLKPSPTLQSMDLAPVPERQHAQFHDPGTPQPVAVPDLPW